LCNSPCPVCCWSSSTLNLERFYKKKNLIIQLCFSREEEEEKEEVEVEEEVEKEKEEEEEMRLYLCQL